MLGFSVHDCWSLPSPLMIFSSPLSFFFPNAFMFILIDHMCSIKIVWWKGCGHFRHLTFLLPSIVGCLWVLSSRSFEGTVIHSYLKKSTNVSMAFFDNDANGKTSPRPQALSSSIHICLYSSSLFSSPSLPFPLPLCPSASFSSPLFIIC